MVRIEEIVGTLEEGGVGLDESIRLLEEGTKLVKACQKALEQAEVRVNKLIDREGRVEEERFSEAEEGGDG